MRTLSRSVALLLAGLGCVSLSNCRSLTSQETTFLNTVMGYQQASRRIDLSKVTILCKAPNDPSVLKKAMAQVAAEAGGDLTTRQFETVESSVVRKAEREALTIGNLIYFKPDACRADFADGWDSDDVLPALSAPLFAHEIFHVWQWQNSSVTGYSLLKAASEHCAGCDPYDYDLVPGKPFLSYRFEQQGQMVQHYVEFTLDKTNEQLRAKLKRLIDQALDVDQLVAAIRTRAS